MQTRWIEILLIAGGVASIIALFVSEAARHHRLDGFRRDVPGSRRVDPPHREAADYRVSGVLPTWRP
jgi:hypothetical protein